MLERVVQLRISHVSESIYMPIGRNKWHWSFTLLCRVMSLPLRFIDDSLLTRRRAVLPPSISTVDNVSVRAINENWRQWRMQHSKPTVTYHVCILFTSWTAVTCTNKMNHSLGQYTAKSGANKHIPQRRLSKPQHNNNNGRYRACYCLITSVLRRQYRTVTSTVDGRSTPHNSLHAYLKARDAGSSQVVTEE